VQDEWTLFTDESGRRAVARLVSDTEGRSLVSEAGKLDVNTIPEAVLKLVPAIGPEIAPRIVSARTSAKFLSVGQLAQIEGLRNAFVPPAGEEGTTNGSEDAFVPPQDDVPEAPLSASLTVFSFDPNVQAGMGRNAESHTGVRRISLGGKWSERLGRAITDRFDENAANVVKSLLEQGTKFEKDSDIVKVLRRFNVPAEDWAEVLDAFCSDAGPYRLGRIDVLNAPQSVLACIPGIDSAAAEQIVLRRSKLPPEQRMSLVWLVSESILTVEQFEQAIDLLTTRTLQWRVVVEAGFVEAGSDEGTDSPPLIDRVVVEAVIDVASERPRIAYLRDISMAAAAQAFGPVNSGSAEAEPAKRPPASATPAVPVSSVSGDRQDGTPRAESPAQPTAPPPAPAADEKDPRLGRWTSGGQ
jgi:hypothetical protein